MTMSADAPLDDPPLVERRVLIDQGVVPVDVFSRLFPDPCVCECCPCDCVSDDG